ncbi:MAG: hypothetical protein HY049_03020 [Acidobacteria bacterium]|nr:hypothetical protein [Acidobacteriota bacterium]
MAGIALFIAIGGGIVLLLWNWLLPPLFGWREINFWQALGLLTLCRILFGGLGSHGSGHSRIRARVQGRMAEHLGERMAARWDRMSPEERERFRQGLGGRCGFGPPDGENKQP